MSNYLTIRCLLGDCSEFSPPLLHFWMTSDVQQVTREYFVIPFYIFQDKKCNAASWNLQLRCKVDSQTLMILTLSPKTSEFCPSQQKFLNNLSRTDDYRTQSSSFLGANRAAVHRSEDRCFRPDTLWICVSRLRRGGRTSYCAERHERMSLWTPWALNWGPRRSFCRRLVSLKPGLFFCWRIQETSWRIGTSTSRERVALQFTDEPVGAYGRVFGLLHVEFLGLCYSRMSADQFDKLSDRIQNSPWR